MAHPVLEKIKGGVGDRLGEAFVKSAKRIYIEVAPGDLVDVARYVFGNLGARYIIATGIHHPDCFEVLHHFGFDGDHTVVSLRVKADVDSPRLPSITPVIKGAEFIEREMHDLLGIKFDGHPNLVPLLRAEDWPPDLFPLRRGVALDGTIEGAK